MCLACEIAVEGQSAIEKATAKYITNVDYNNKSD